MRQFVLSVASLLCFHMTPVALIAANGSTTVLRSTQIQSILNDYLQSNPDYNTTTSVSKSVESHIDRMIREKAEAAENSQPGTISEPQLLTVTVDDFVGLINRSQLPTESYESEDNIAYRELIERGQIQVDPETHLLTIDVSEGVRIQVQPSVPLSIESPADSCSNPSP